MKCRRCGYKWETRKDNPKSCPRCKGRLDYKPHPRIAIGLMAAFLLIVMASGAAQAHEEENFGLGAEVEIEVERATQQQPVIKTDPFLPLYLIISFMLGIVVALLFAAFKMRRVTATNCAQKGGETFG